MRRSSGIHVVQLHLIVSLSIEGAVRSYRKILTPPFSASGLDDPLRFLQSRTSLYGDLRNPSRRQMELAMQGAEWAEYYLKRVLNAYGL